MCCVTVFDRRPEGEMTDETQTCCAPLVQALLSEDEAVELASILKALADPVRLRLLSMVAAAGDVEACACDLVPPVGRSQPTVSHHMAILVDAGLVTRSQRGKWAWYRLRPERLEMVRSALDPAAVSA
jgi:ArsR family transcriptional regulator